MIAIYCCNSYHKVVVNQVINYDNGGINWTKFKWKYQVEFISWYYKFIINATNVQKMEKTSEEITSGDNYWINESQVEIIRTESHIS